ncbi:2TM domain-containing protein [Nonlabens sp. Asnod3-A02]|uniref:2TM domain-containing protein n=1 Tax=Nonlabens sp. Asnod3-A02 TaxID=3160579 RepID=UPI00386D9432
MKKEETYQERYTRAKARVEEIKAFYSHLTVYIIVNIGIAGLNYYHDGWEETWFLYPLGGWGIGVVGHAIGTFGSNPFTSKNWEERKIQELMDKERS